jgi:phosphohistidine swiveling domain-containing protein
MKSIALLAVAGLATVASAQLNVSLSFDKTSILVGETAIATVTASFTGAAGSYFSSVSANFVASDNGLASASSASGLGWGVPALGAIQNGTANGASLNGTFAAQQSLFGAPNTSNPFTVLTFVVTGTAAGELSYTATRANSAPGVFSFTDAAGGPFAAPTYSDALSSGTLVINAIPAPSAMALLGLGGLVATRRRR